MFTEHSESHRENKLRIWQVPTISNTANLEQKESTWTPAVIEHKPEHISAWQGNVVTKWFYPFKSQKGPRNLPEAIPGFQTEYNVATVGEKITESSSQIAQSQPQHPVLTEADKVVKQVGRNE